MKLGELVDLLKLQTAVPPPRRYLPWEQREIYPVPLYPKWRTLTIGGDPYELDTIYEGQYYQIWINEFPVDNKESTAEVVLWDYRPSWKRTETTRDTIFAQKHCYSKEEIAETVRYYRDHPEEVLMERLL